MEWKANVIFDIIRVFQDYKWWSIKYYFIKGFAYIDISSKIKQPYYHIISYYRFSRHSLNFPETFPT